MVRNVCNKLMIIIIITLLLYTFKRTQYVISKVHLNAEMLHINYLIYMLS